MTVVRRVSKETRSAFVTKVTTSKNLFMLIEGDVKQETPVIKSLSRRLLWTMAGQSQ